MQQIGRLMETLKIGGVKLEMKDIATPQKLVQAMEQRKYKVDSYFEEAVAWWLRTHQSPYSSANPVTEILDKKIKSLDLKKEEKKSSAQKWLAKETAVNPYDEMIPVYTQYLLKNSLEGSAEQRESLAALWEKKKDQKKMQARFGYSAEVESLGASGSSLKQSHTLFFKGKPNETRLVRYSSAVPNLTDIANILEDEAKMLPIQDNGIQATLEKFKKRVAMIEARINGNVRSSEMRERIVKHQILMALVDLREIWAIDMAAVCLESFLVEFEDLRPAFEEVCNKK